MRTAFHVIYELLLILASVLIFRSAWTLLDRHFIALNSDVGLLVSLLFGAAVAAGSLYMLSREYHAY